MNNIKKELTKIVKAHPREKNWWEKLSENTAKLVKLISNNENLSCFDEQVHMLGNSGRSFSYDEFAGSLIQRTRQVGVNQSLGEVTEYLDSKKLSLEYAFLLAGIKIDKKFTFSNGVQIISIENIQKSSLKSVLEKERWGLSIKSTNIHSILVADYKVKKHFHSNIIRMGIKQNNKHQPPPHQILEDTRLILSLARSADYGIPLLASTVIVPEKLSFLERGISWSIFSEPLNQLSPEIIELELKYADKLLQRFLVLTPKTKDRIRIALKRLNDAKIDPDYVNKSINLRICLENLFRNQGERNAIRKSISERMPSYTSFSKRKSGKIYGFLSEPIHSGRIPSHPTINIKDIICELRVVIIKFIKNGSYPVWQVSKKKNIISRLIHYFLLYFK